MGRTRFMIGMSQPPVDHHVSWRRTPGLSPPRPRCRRVCPMSHRAPPSSPAPRPMSARPPRAPVRKECGGRARARARGAFLDEPTTGLDPRQPAHHLGGDAPDQRTGHNDPSCSSARRRRCKPLALRQAIWRKAHAVWPVNFRLLARLFAQIQRVLEINRLHTNTAEVVDADRETLVIGQPRRSPRRTTSDQESRPTTAEDHTEVRIPQAERRQTRVCRRQRNHRQRTRRGQLVPVKWQSWRAAGARARRCRVPIAEARAQLRVAPA